MSDRKRPLRHAKGVKAALSTAVTAAGFCGQSEILGRDERLMFDTVAGPETFAPAA
ncbi:MAG: hypothetical protein ACLQAT_20255 [Candidatus Binataceae bacterium]